MAVLHWITIAWSAVLLSSMISMMSVFMGSGSGDLHDLLTLQLWLLPVTILAVVAYVLRIVHLTGGLSALWRHTPAWMVFTVCLALSLVLIAELSFILVTVHAPTSRPWIEHIPSVTALFSSLALAVAYAHARIEFAGAKKES